MKLNSNNQKIKELQKETKRLRKALESIDSILEDFPGKIVSTHSDIWRIIEKALYK